MKLSVIMPLKCLNPYLLHSLESISNQNYQDFILIVICPTVEYESIANFFSNLKLNFQYTILHSRLNGFTFAVNLGIAHATTEFIARWDADDFSDPNRFKRQLQEFDLDENLAIVGTRVVIVNEYGIPDPYHKFKFYSDSKEIRNALKYRQPFAHSALMFRRNILLSNKGYLYGNNSEDHELFIRMARNPELNFKNISDITTYYRRHPDQLTDIVNVTNQFYDVSGFLFTEFLRTKNPMYLIGICANIPLIRKFRHSYRSLLRALF